MYASSIQPRAGSACQRGRAQWYIVNNRSGRTINLNFFKKKKAHVNNHSTSEATVQVQILEEPEPDFNDTMSLWSVRHINSGQHPSRSSLGQPSTDPCNYEGK